VFKKICSFSARLAEGHQARRSRGTTGEAGQVVEAARSIADGTVPRRFFIGVGMAPKRIMNGEL